MLLNCKKVRSGGEKKSGKKPRFTTKTYFYSTPAYVLSLTLSLSGVPTDFFTILKPHYREISKFYAAQERRTTDFESIGRAADLDVTSAAAS